ncbi:Holliday junction DNA helicase RuvA [Gleimia coleocanis DSM 15436]|uniref:Holliday junction branch migration complex subunit RuvA n=1 Tax=Gleimia coleocanis DSM 15436 TaxID=525245 RepID=C0W1Q3_9ACTO|nr:Holliday junction branch migration protein RuvA [Gleimia coleocanis]EEH63419.1 Holliday junction DNA helicase RuvA [Gleimia coleocanis DSM 15436]
MISFFQGEVQAIKPGHLVLVNGGFGLSIQVTVGTANQVRHGELVGLYTSLIVREDSLTLYGFLTEDERDTFNVLQTVSKIGPRTALQALEALTPDELRQAVISSDEKTLQRIPGIGKKSAQRMLIEIGDKLGTPTGNVKLGTTVSVAETEVIAGLVSLGYSEVSAQAAVEPFQGSDMNTSEMLRAALIQLGTNRG